MKHTSHIVLSLNIVILAKHHNPSILNPDFLKMHKIVDQDWEIAETITTPPFSQTRFKNGISVTIDNERLNITHNINDDYPNYSPIYDLAEKYLKILKLVRYTAVGLNWDILVPVNVPGSWLMDRFLKKKSIPKSSPELEELGLMLRFNLAGQMTNFRLAPGNFSLQDGSQVEAIRVSSNTHHETENTTVIHDILTKWHETQQNVKKQIERLTN